jgi:hypothetical protein
MPSAVKRALGKLSLLKTVVVSADALTDEDRRMLSAMGIAWEMTLRLRRRMLFGCEPVPGEDDTVGITLVACGVLNRDVIVSAYVFGEEDKSMEDFWLEEIAHGDLATNFYRRGFRRIIVSDSNKTSQIVFAPGHAGDNPGQRKTGILLSAVIRSPEHGIRNCFRLHSPPHLFNRQIC